MDNMDNISNDGSVIEELELQVAAHNETINISDSMNDTITIDDSSLDAPIPPIPIVGFIPIAPIAVAQIPLIIIDSDNEAKDDSDGEGDKSYQASEQSLKDVEAVGDTYNECKRLKKGGKIEELYEAYRDLKFLTDDLRDETLEKEKFSVRVKEIKAHIAIMRYRELKNKPFENNLAESDTDGDRNEAFNILGIKRRQRTSSLKLKMVSDDAADYVIHKDSDGYSSDNERVLATSYAINTDFSFDDLKICWSELKICTSEELNVKKEKMNAAMKIFEYKKALADFHSKQLRGELEIRESSANKSFDIGGSLDVNASIGNVSNVRSECDESMELEEAPNFQEEPDDFDVATLEEFPVIR